MTLKVPANLTELAYRAIKDGVLQGSLNHRTHLTEHYLASRFGISKSPIREALNRLEAEGLISIQPRRGASVIDFSAQDIKEIYELREALESCAVRNLVLSPRTAARLHALANDAVKAFRNHHKLDYIRADSSFHGLLAQASNNSRLRKLLQEMTNLTILLRQRTFELSSASLAKQHARIITALEKGQRDKAARLMAEHICLAGNRLLHHLNRTGGGAAVVSRERD